VSLEVSPKLAHDTHGTIDQARSLWRAVDRPNVLIKIPGTKEGLPAIRQCIADGLNINVTLLFGLERYREVAEAYIRGLESRARRKEDLHGVRSVASFFLSRVAGVWKRAGAAGSRTTRLGCDRQCEDCVPGLPGDRFHRTVPEARAAGRAQTVALVGQHERQIEGVQRRKVCRATDRTGNDQHDAA
jgi:hypothetical protein